MPIEPSRRDSSVGQERLCYPMKKEEKLKLKMSMDCQAIQVDLVVYQKFLKKSQNTDKDSCMGQEIQPAPAPSFPGPRRSTMESRMWVQAQH